MQEIVIIGAGNMGRAIATSFAEQSEYHVTLKTHRSTVDNMLNFSNIDYTSLDQDIHHLKNPYVFCAVKPDKISDVLHQSADLLTIIKPKMLISVAAGAKYQSLREIIHQEIPVVRSMPNLSVATGQGIIGFYTAEAGIQQEFIQLCRPMGMVHPLQHEAEFDLFTALAGSGPAFVFHLLEAFADAASALGMNPEDAVLLTRKMVQGASSMLSDSVTVTQLREQVTSKKGTTWAGLQELMNADLDRNHSRLKDLLLKTLQASQARSREMG